MFKAEYNKESQTVSLSGNFDTSKADEVKALLGSINNSITVDMSGLDFISSSGIGIMVMTYQRLKGLGENICLINLNENIKKVFRVSLLDKVFTIK